MPEARDWPSRIGLLKTKPTRPNVQQWAQQPAKRREVADPVAKVWAGKWRMQVQVELSASHEKFFEEQRNKPVAKRCETPLERRVRPRVYVYELPPHLLPPPTSWRHVLALKAWVENSRYYEKNPFCADWFLVPSHPANREQNVGSTGHVDVGDLRVAQAFGYIRDRFPFWNRTARLGVARHLVLLPCDHGPGDCAFTRPNVPYKYAPWAAASAAGDRWHANSARWQGLGRKWIEQTWAENWEQVRATA
jgi:hypothetical protein